MSLIFPYSPTDVLTYIATTFSISTASLTDFEAICLTVLANLYFFIFWFIFLYFTLKLFNRVWERFF